MPPRGEAADVVRIVEGVSGAVPIHMDLDALHAIGRRDDAERLFGQLLALRNDVGMLAEQYDPASGRQLGNTPQVFSLVGLDNSAGLLSGTTTRTSGDSAAQHIRG